MYIEESKNMTSKDKNAWKCSGETNEIILQSEKSMFIPWMLKNKCLCNCT